MGCGPSVQATPRSPAPHMADASPTPKPLYSVEEHPLHGRKLVAKSKPFWQLEEERKQAQDEGGSDRTGSPSGSSSGGSSPSSSRDESSTAQSAAEASVASVSGELCAALSACVVPSSVQNDAHQVWKPTDVQQQEQQQSTTTMTSASEEPAHPAPAIDPMERPLNQPAVNEPFCSIGGGCGCGPDEAEAPLDPLDWIAGLQDEDTRELEHSWFSRLSEAQFRVLRMKGTEEIHTGELENHFAKSGTYVCAACETPLYDAQHKFKSGHGWPAFSDNLPDALVRTEIGRNKKIEITCSGCGGHVGHVFKSKRYPPPTHERHCSNSISLKYVPPATVASA